MCPIYKHPLLSDNHELCFLVASLLRAGQVEEIEKYLFTTWLAHSQSENILVIRFHAKHPALPFAGLFLPTKLSPRQHAAPSNFYDLAPF